MSLRLLQQIWRVHRHVAAHHWPTATAAQCRLYTATVKPALLLKQKDIDVKELLQHLEAQCASNGNLNAEQLTKVIQQLEVETGTPPLSAEQTHFILDACGTHIPALDVQQRQQLFERFWRYLQQRGQLTASHYHTRLQVLQHNRAPLADLSTFMTELAALGSSASAASADLYGTVLAVVCATGNMQQATEVLAAMRASNLALTERNFDALILGHARNGDLHSCRTVLDSMQAAGVPLGTATQSVLVSAYLENGELTKATHILTQFHRQFDAAQVMQMLRSVLLVPGDMDASIIMQLVRELPAEYTAGAEVPLSLRNFCIEMLHSGKMATVRTIVEALPTPHFNENQNIDTFGVFLLHQLFRAQIDTSQLIELAELLVRSGKNTRALHIASEIALRRSPGNALPLLNALAKVEPLRPHYFWPLLMHNFRLSGERGIVQTLRLMTEQGVECDDDTLRHYVLPRLHIILENPGQALKLLDGAGVKPSQMLTPVLAHLLAAQKLTEALELLPLYPAKVQVVELLTPLTNLVIQVRATKRYHHFAKLLHGLAAKASAPKEDFVGQLLVDVLATQPRLRSDGQALQRLIGELECIGVTISSAAVDAVQSALKAESSLEASDVEPTLQSLQKMRNRELISLLPPAGVAGVSNESAGSAGSASSSFIKHPRDMTLDELECHLIELEAKRLNTRGVLRRLLQLCVRDGRLERARELKAKCDVLKVQVSPGMLASILDMYIKLKDLPKAQETLQRLGQDFPGFQVDEHKLIDYAALLVQKGQLEPARELLQQRSATQRIQGGDYVLKNVWNFLSSVAQHAASLPSGELSNESNMARDMFAALQKWGYCRSHNTVLGPIVREYLLRGDIEAAVDEFRRLAERFRHTPLQFELLSLLVRLSNGREAEVLHYGSAASGAAAQRLLAVVSETVSKVHGALNLNSALLLAFAESGTDAQLRRLLIDPEFRINQDLLLKNCEHLGKEGAVQTLLRLARGSRGIGHVVDEQRIYDMLLQHCIAANNYAAALDLFDRLEADDELKMSQEFLRQLVKLLRSNNVEVPSTIALRAQIK